jgi:RNA polymerase sigma factor (sigma-70 family)
MAIVTGCRSMGADDFVCAQGGCRNCLNKLMHEHEGLVHAVVRAQGRGGIPYEELIQDGRIGLWHAILHYDPGRGNPFVSYAWVVVRRRIWRVTACPEQDQDDEAEAWLELAQELLEEEWWRWHVRQALLEVVEKLPVRLERLIHQVYGLDEPGPYCLATLGRQWGISRERVRQLHNEALTLLRLPALSMRLRSLCEQDSRVDYQQALRLNRAWQLSQRRRP